MRLATFLFSAAITAVGCTDEPPLGFTQREALPAERPACLVQSNRNPTWRQSYSILKLADADFNFNTAKSYGVDGRIAALMGIKTTTKEGLYLLNFHPEVGWNTSPTPVFEFPVSQSEYSFGGQLAADALGRIRIAWTEEEERADFTVRRKMMSRLYEPGVGFTQEDTILDYEVSDDDLGPYYGLLSLKVSQDDSSTVMWREFDTPGGIHPFFLRAYGADGSAGPTETIESAIADTSPTQIIVIPSKDSTWLFVQAFNLISGPQFWLRRRTADGRWSEAVKLFDLPESHRIDTVKPFLFQDRHLYFFTGIANRSALPSGIYVNMKVFDIGAEGSASELFSLDLYSLSDAEFGGFDATFDEAGRWFVAWGAEPHGTLTSEIRTANGVQMEPVYRSPDYSLNASFSPNVDAVNPRLHLMRDGTPVLVWNQFYQQILPSLPLYRAAVGRWDGSKWITPTQGIGSTTAPTQSPLLLANCADQLTVLTPLYPVIVDAIMATEFR